MPLCTSRPIGLNAPSPQDALSRLVEVVTRAHAVNPGICFEVFIHKVDGDLFLSDEHKVDCHRDIQQVR
jgi:Ras-related GTP-binding protein C/D